MSPRRTITGVEAEEIAVRRIAGRLLTDRAYKNAGDAEQRAVREAEISEQVWSTIRARWEVIDA